MGREAGMEVSLFVGPRAGGTSVRAAARPRAPRTAGRSAACADGLRVRSRTCPGRRRRHPRLPGRRYGPARDARGMQTGRRAAARLRLEGLGHARAVEPAAPRLRVLAGRASDVNLPICHDRLVQLAEMRAVREPAIDLYVESPDTLGGVVRGAGGRRARRRWAHRCTPSSGYETRSSLYPRREHLAAAGVAIAREKVHRARSRWSGCAGRRRSSGSPTGPLAPGPGIRRPGPHVRSKGGFMSRKS